MSYETNAGKWEDMWKQSNHDMLIAMIRNLGSDIEAGYPLDGKEVSNQLDVIENYQGKIGRIEKRFKKMDAEAVDRWCYEDLLKRGVIA